MYEWNPRALAHFDDVNNFGLTAVHACFHTHQIIGPVD
jgi:hypothetical protein